MAFTVIVGCRTGVEVAGSIAEPARHTLVRHFRRIRSAEARHPRDRGGAVPPGSFREDLGRRAQGHREALGVTVMTGAKVEEVAQANLVVSWRRMGCGLVVFAAGVTARPSRGRRAFGTDRGGRIPAAPTIEGSAGPVPSP